MKISNNNVALGEIVNRKRLNVFRYAIEEIRDKICDIWFGVDTTVAVREQEHDNFMNYMYEPFPYWKLSHLFKKYKFSDKDAFIDIGCGKGRVLVQAVIHGCKNIYGLDISSEMIMYADKNLKRCSRRSKGLEYKLFCANAKDFDFPKDVNKVFLNNPFHLKILLKVIKSLRKSIEKCPREVLLFLAGNLDIPRYMERISCLELVTVELEDIFIYKM